MNRLRTYPGVGRCCEVARRLRQLWPVWLVLWACVVQGSETAPSISVPPTNQVTMVLSNVTFTVTVTGSAPLVYQWQKDGTNLANGPGLSGVDSPVLTILNPQPGDSGQYSVTVSNSAGSVTGAATLTVVPVFVWGAEAEPPPADATNLVALSPGTSHNLALRADGTVVGWGENSLGQINIPASATNVVSLAAGEWHSMALRQDGSFLAWGWENYNDTLPPADATNLIAIAAGQFHSLGLREDGRVVGWGSDYVGESEPPRAYNVIALAAWGWWDSPINPHSLALSANGLVVGWGYNGYGQCNPPASATNVVAIAAGKYHSLALRQDGTVLGWGDNRYGQCTVPAGASNAVAIAAGEFHSLALLQNGTVVAWGYNTNGSATAPAGLSNVVAIAARHYRNLALVQDQGLPNIWHQPPDRIVPLWRTTMLNCEVIGSPPVRFQWYFNGFPMAGETRNWLALPNIDVTSAGNYQLVAANGSGAVTSRVAVVRVVPDFLTQPTNQTLGLGATATFQVVVSGVGPLTYQWYCNGAPLVDDSRISGSTTASLSIANLQRTDAGGYQVVVSHPGGSNTSAVATLTLLLPPVISLQPTNQIVSVGKDLSLSVVASGTDPLAYQWRKDGQPLSSDGHLSGTTGPVLRITDVQTSHSGSYDVVVTNNYGATTSLVAVLEALLREPNIVVQPSNQCVLPGRTATFAVRAEGAEPLVYQWFGDEGPLVDGGRMSGARTAALVLANVQAGDAGAYWVVLSNSWGMTTSSIAGLSLATTRYVNGNNPAPSPPYTNWASAAQTIQDAVDVAGTGDEIVVTNGTYATGGRAVYGTMTNRVAVDRAVSVRSVNGPEVTLIQGKKGSIRCAYLTNGAALIGFTLKSGGTRSAGDWRYEQSGGGVLCESVSAVVSNCILSGNLAAIEGGGVYSGTLNNCALSGNTAAGPCGGQGGGAAMSTLNNCVLSGNSATWGGGADNCILNNCQVTGNSAADPSGARTGAGGGAISCSLTNCTVVNNSALVYGGGTAWGTLVGCLVARNGAHSGGGASAGLLINCTVVANSAPFDSDLSGGLGGGVSSCTVLNSIVVQNQSGWGLSDANASSSSLSYSCTYPVPAGTGNIGEDPGFVNDAGGNYRLQPTSPCRNAGSNDCVAIITDLDGAPRVVEGTVDIGAYERQELPFVVMPPVSQSVLIHSNVLFTASALGEEPLSYRWQKDGVDLADDGRISGTSTPSLAITSLVLEDGGSYRVVVSNARGTVTSAAAILTPLGLPAISVPPVSRSLPAGTNASFSVTASGLGTLAYQWRFNSAVISGASNSSFSLTNIQSSHMGNYDVVVTNEYGAITSQVATLTVLPSAPWITLQPTSRVAAVGQTITLSTAARGTEPMTCQWQKNGSDIPGATAFTLVLNNLNASFAGIYRAVVSNAAGVTASTNVNLAVVPILVWGQTNNPQLLISAAVPAGATNVVALAAGRTGYSLPCLALRGDGTLIGWGFSPGERGIPATASNIVAVTCGGEALLDRSMPSHALALRADGTVLGWGSNDSGQTNVPSAATNVVAIAAGGYHSLALRANGSLVAWGRGSDGQTNVPPGATNIVAIAAGAYHNLALRADGTVVGWGRNSSGQATNLADATNIIAIAAGGNQSLALRADGTLLGLLVTNATKSVLLGPPPPDATNLVAISAGALHVLGLRADGTAVGWGDNRYGQASAPGLATNVIAIAAGGYHSLALMHDPTLPVLPVVAPLPAQREIVTGSDVTLWALANGGLLSYQWQFNGTNLPGATANWLCLSAAAPNQTGNYSVRVSNLAGTVTSSATRLVVWPGLTLKRFGDDCVATWEGPFTLQSSTNVAGPYLDAPGAGPITNGVSGSAQRFFRLRF